MPAIFYGRAWARTRSFIQAPPSQSIRVDRTYLRGPSFFTHYPGQPWRHSWGHQTSFPEPHVFISNSAGDAAGRGLVILYVIRYIKDRRPRLFILENVANLATVHRDTLNDILKVLATHCPEYNVKWKILNARTHGAVPQNRERVFIVGLNKEKCTGDLMWSWPTEVFAS